MQRSKFDPHKHHRRSIRLKGYDYSQSGAYFITICTYQRLPLFGEIVDAGMQMNFVGRISRKEWERLPGRFPLLEIGLFVVMPNHIHAILIVGRGTAGHEEATVLKKSRRAPTETAKERYGILIDGRGTAGLDEAIVVENPRRALPRWLWNISVDLIAFVRARHFYRCALIFAFANTTHLKNIRVCPCSSASLNHLPFVFILDFRYNYFYRFS
jgi:REP element-mobilizing transposase RayT